MSETVMGFTGSVGQSASNFTGREWVFNAIDKWLADSDASRCYLLTGMPGCGKTAIAAQLAQHSQGTVPPPDQASRLTKDFLSATHFCSAGNIFWSNPHEFTRSLSLQLAHRYQVFAKALAEKRGDRRISINLVQNIATGGQVTGIVINNLNVNGLPPEDAFIQVVLEPLKVLFRSQPDSQVVILVDALDEALSYSGEVNIVSLLASVNKLSASDLPTGVRLILTARQDARVVDELRNIQELFLSSAQFDQYNQNDIRRYVRARLRDDKKLADKAAQAKPGPRVELGEVVPRKARGNFQYVRFLLDAIAKGLRSLTELEGLPEGLDELYFDSLERVVKLGKRDWFSAYAPLMGVLSVTQESLTLAQLQALTQQPESSVQEYRRNLQQFIEEVTPQDAQEKRYRLYHQSVVDFLHCKELSLNEKTTENKFYLPADEWHRNLADRCESGGIALLWEDTRENAAEQGRREYARQHYITHLYQAREWKRLCAVLDVGVYGRQKVSYYLSTFAYAQDLELGQQAVTRYELNVGEGVALLPALWRYSLLRRSLGTQVDNYPDIAFNVMVALGRQQQALEVVSLLTDFRRQVRILMSIGIQIEGEGRNEEAWQILSQASSKIRERIESAPGIVQHIVQELAEAPTFEQKIRFLDELAATAQLIGDDKEKMEALLAIAVALAEAQGQEKAEIVGQTIPCSNQDAQKLEETVDTLVKTRLWNSATRIVLSMGDKAIRHRLLSVVVVALLKVQEWDRAKELALLDSMEERFYAMAAVARARAEAQPELAEELMAEIEGLAFAEDANTDYQYLHQKSSDRDHALRLAAKDMAKFHLWDRAISVAWSIYNYGTRDEALSAVIEELVEAELWERAIEVAWSMHGEHDSEYHSHYEQVKAMHGIAKALMRTGQQERARELLTQLMQILFAQNQKDSVLRELATALITVELWDRAETVIQAISDSGTKFYALIALASALSTIQPERTHVLLSEAETLANAELLSHRYATSSMRREGKARALGDIIAVLAKMRLWERAIEMAQAIDMRASRERDEAFVKIVDALGAAHEWDRVLSVAQAIVSEDACGTALVAVVKALGAVREWESAFAMMQAIESDRHKADALVALIDMLEEAQVAENIQSISKFFRLIRKASSKEDSSSSDEAERSRESGIADGLSRVNDNNNIENLDVEREENLLTDLLSETDSLSPGEAEPGYESNDDDLDIGEMEEALWPMTMTPSPKMEQLWNSLIQAIQTISYDRIRSDTLGKLFLTLAKVELLDKALEVALLFTSSEEQAYALLAIVLSMIEAGEWNRAVTIACSIKEGQQKAQALATLAAMQVRIQQPEQAQALLSEARAASQFITENTRLKTDTLGMLADGLVQGKQLDRAIIVIRSIPDASKRVKLFLDIAAAMAATEPEAAVSLLMEAATVTQSLEGSEKVESLDTIAGALLALGKTKQADRLRVEILTMAVAFRQQQGDTKNAERLKAIADALTTTEQREQAEALWAEVLSWSQEDTSSQNEEAVEEAEEDTDAGDDVDDLPEEMQEWERDRQRYNREFRINRQKDERLVATIKSRMSEGQVEQAAALLFEQRYFSDDILLRGLVYRLKQEQQWEQALALAWSINKPWQKVQALTGIAAALRQAGYRDRAMVLLLEAEAVAQSIEKEDERTDTPRHLRNYERDSALLEVARALINAQELEAAEIVAASISEGKWEKDQILLWSVHALASMQQWDRAMDVMRRIKEEDRRIGSDRRVLAMAAIISTLVRYNHQARALRLLQQSWLYASTRDDLLERLEQARAFIVREPEMGWAFYEAFAWVDNFLKG